MEDYHSWLDNIATADMRASKYFVDKVTPSSFIKLFFMTKLTNFKKEI